MRFVSLSRRQWEKYAPIWKGDYSDLVDIYRELDRRFTTLCDLLIHDDGLVPSLQIDESEAKQWEFQSVQRMQLSIVPDSSSRFPSV